MAFLLKNFFLHVVTVLHQALNLSEKLIGRMYLFQLYLCSLCEFWPESTLYPTGFFFFFGTSRESCACPVPVPA